MKIIGDHLSITDGVVSRIYDTEIVPLTARQTEMLSDIAAIRWVKENGGMPFAMAIVPTDDRSKLLIMGAREKAKEDPTYSKRWKIAPGQYIDLSAETIVSLSEALETHVAACFAREEAIAAQILAEGVTLADLDALDINSGWPANQ